MIRNWYFEFRVHVYVMSFDVWSIRIFRVQVQSLEFKVRVCGLEFFWITT